MKRFKTIVLLVSLFAATSAFAESNGKALGDVCRSSTSRGWLYKPQSQDSGAPREGKPMVLFSSGNPAKSSLNVYSSNGVKICSFKRWAGGNRYYSGTGCNKKGSVLTTLSRNAGGNGKIYVQGKGTACLGPITATSRNDKR